MKYKSNYGFHIILMLIRTDSEQNLLLFLTLILYFSYYNYSRVDGEKGKGQQSTNTDKLTTTNPAVSVNINNNVETGSTTNLNCVRCSRVLPDQDNSGGSTAGLLLSQTVSCSICSLRVCKSCAVWNQSKNTLTCGHCHPPT